MRRPMLVGVALVACTRESPPPPPFVVRDSGGVQIVENHRPATDGWTVDTTPAVRLGADDERDGGPLNRIIGALRLEDGRIVIANTAPPILRWYDSAGRYERGAGQWGGGPGEFSTHIGPYSTLWRLGEDSIALSDPAPPRWQIFDNGGRFVHSSSLRLPANVPHHGAPLVVDRLSGARNVIAASSGIESPGSGDVWRDTTWYGLWDDGGTYVRPFARLPGIERFGRSFVARFSAATSPGGPPPPPAPLPILSTGEVVAIQGGSFYHAAPERFDIAVFDTTGHLVRAIRRSGPRRPLTDRLIATAKAERYADVSSEAVRRDLRRWLDAAPYPDSLPAIGQMVASRDELWVQEYPLPGSDRASWLVFDRDGRWLATASLPRAFRVQQVGDGFVLGVIADADGVEQVHLLRVARVRGGARQ